MYPLHDMDKRNIFQTIEKINQTTMDFDRYNMLGSKIQNEMELTLFEIDFLILLINHNDELSPRYKNLLIEILNEGKE